MSKGMLMRVILLTGVACTAGVIAPVDLPAQAKVELIPFFASFYPLAIVNEFDGGGGATITERQTAAPGFGGRFRFWLSNKVGLEGSGAYTTSGTRFTSSEDTVSVGISLGGTIVTGNARILYRPARTNLHFILGGGVVSRGGHTWDFDFITEKTTFAGVVGLGLRASVTPKFSLDLSVEANLYSFDPDGDGTNYDQARFQSDVYVTIGIPIALAR